MLVLVTALAYWRNIELLSCLLRHSLFIGFFYDFYLFIFREGKGGRKRGKYQLPLPVMRPLLGTWPATQACALIGNWTCNPLVLRLVLNPLNQTSQGSLVDSCLYPDWGLNPQPWSIRLMLQPTELTRAWFPWFGPYSLFLRCLRRYVGGKAYVIMFDTERVLGLSLAQYFWKSFGSLTLLRVGEKLRILVPGKIRRPTRFWMILGV